MRRSETLSKVDRRIFYWASAVFLAIILDGAARKWLLPGSMQAIPYFAKDVLAAAFVIRNPLRLRDTRASLLVGYITAVAAFLATAFVLGVIKYPTGAILVYKNAVLWPLFAIHLGFRLTAVVVERLLRLALLCSIAMAFLAIAQYYSSPASLLNRYAWGEEDVNRILGGVATAGEFVRATGTFSYLSGLTAFSLTMFSIFLGRAISLPGGRQLLYASFGVASSVACGLASGNRSAQVYMLVISGTTLVMSPKDKGMTGRLLVGFLGAAAFSLLVWNSSLSQGVLQRWNNTDRDEFEGRVTGSSMGQALSDTLFDNPIGSGLGIYTGFSAVTGTQERLNAAYNESEISRVAAESGFLGFIAMGLGFGMLFRVAKWMSQLTKTALKLRLLPTFFGSLIALFYGLWHDHNACGLWWWTIALWLGQGLNIPLCSARTHQNMSSNDRLIPIQVARTFAKTVR